jgi:hypothetical protein
MTVIEAYLFWNLNAIRFIFLDALADGAIKLHQYLQGIL